MKLGALKHFGDFSSGGIALLASLFATQASGSNASATPNLPPIEDCVTARFLNSKAVSLRPHNLGCIALLGRVGGERPEQTPLPSAALIDEGTAAGLIGATDRLPRAERPIPPECRTHCFNGPRYWIGQRKKTTACLKDAMGSPLLTRVTRLKFAIPPSSSCPSAILVCTSSTGSERQPLYSLPRENEDNV